MISKKKIVDYFNYYNIATRWKDVDSFGHINNSVYLTYIEDARMELFNKWKLNNSTKSLIVASIKIDYISQINHPSSLIVGQRISKIGNKSFNIESAIFNKNKDQASVLSNVTCVCYNYNLNKTVMVFDVIKNDFQRNNL